MLAKSSGVGACRQSMRVSVRRPDGGEVTMPLGTSDSVSQLRQMIKWCIENNDWEYNAIPPDIKQQQQPARKSEEVYDDEMWTLNEQDNASGTGTRSLETDPDALDDLESSHLRLIGANASEGEVIENTESGRIEMLYGPVMLQDGYLLSEYGIEDGSFIHPLYTLRGGGGADARSWSVAVAHLPWNDREWYRAGTSSALASVCTSSAMASVSSWWTAAADAAAAVNAQNPLNHPAPLHNGASAASDEQQPGIFGGGQEEEDTAAL
jgi:hypothetical protein